MKCSNKEELIIQYFEGQLSVNDSDELLTHIKSCKSCKNVFDEISILYSSFVGANNFTPDASLKTNFEKLIKEESRELKSKDSINLTINKSFAYNFIKYAAILIVGLFIGWIVNSQIQNKQVAILQDEISKTRNMVVLALLENESASERMRAVSYSNEYGSDSEIINALIHTLNFDSNVNVRLAAVNALYKFKDQPLVKDAFIKTLKTQNDPRIQIRLIDFLVEMKQDNVVPDFYKMLEKNDLNDVVKVKLQEGIGVLI